MENRCFKKNTLCMPLYVQWSQDNFLNDLSKVIGDNQASERGMVFKKEYGKLCTDSTEPVSTTCANVIITDVPYPAILTSVVKCRWSRSSCFHTLFITVTSYRGSRASLWQKQWAFSNALFPGQDLYWAHRRVQFFRKLPPPLFLFFAGFLACNPLNYDRKLSLYVYGRIGCWLV